MDEKAAEKIDKCGIDSIKIRGVLTCESRRGTCPKLGPVAGQDSHPSGPGVGSKPGPGKGGGGGGPPRNRKFTDQIGSAMSLRLSSLASTERSHVTISGPNRWFSVRIGSAMSSLPGQSGSGSSWQFKVPSRQMVRPSARSGGATTIQQISPGG